jgi:FKBP-type peptidyl-prolyl cis-trans isomerase FkpA
VSVAEAAHRPDHRGRAVSLWIGFLLVIAAGVALAWWGAHSVRQRTVQVQTIQAGAGPMIQAQDGVLIDYEGRLSDGKVFDSSAGKGPVPLLANQVIPGFAQALQRMQEGGHYTIRIPAKLAYGAHPPEGAPIPPNADLYYDVKVVKVVPNAALMQGGGGGAPQGQ